MSASSIRKSSAVQLDLISLSSPLKGHYGPFLGNVIDCQLFQRIKVYCCMGCDGKRQKLGAKVVME